MLLAILAFSLSLLGTFLVRSGVLTSVHAFATDPARGVFILAFLAIVIGGSLALFAWRAGSVGLGGSFALVSRESMLLANNIVLIVAMASVLLGTLYPLFLGRTRPGQDFGRAAVFRSGVLPVAGASRLPDGCGSDRAVEPRRGARACGTTQSGRWWSRWSARCCLPFVLGRWSPLIAVGLFLALWLFASTAVNLWQRLKGSHRGSLWARLAANPPSYYGMLLAHFGVGVFIVGVTLVKGYEIERDVRLDVGQRVAVGPYEFAFLGVTPAPGPNYRALVGTVEVRRDGRLIETLHPEKRIYNASGQTMTIAAIDTGISGDRYVSLGEAVGGDGAIAGAWSVRIYLKPFVDWIWLGAFVMALGGFVAVSDRRYRLAVRRRLGALAGAAAGE